MISKNLLALGPNIIGATGGSGTRVVARIVRVAGMFIGENLNVSEDAIEFGAYSDRWINRFKTRRENHASPVTEAAMIADFAEVLEKHCKPLQTHPRPWGWKEPRSIYLLPFLDSQFPNGKFLHMVRDGRDMAFSQNQNQLKKHGKTLLNWKERLIPKPVRSITLWSRINLLAADYGEGRMGDRYLRIRFEDLCTDPAPVIRRMFLFFGLSGDAEQIAGLEVNRPATIGRWQDKNPQTVARINQAAAAALRRFGYVI